MTPTTYAFLAILLAYLIGAIPFAYVFVRAAKGIDIRTVGSGNVGATNASRVLGLRGFLLVFLCDLLKGLLPTLLLPALVRSRTGIEFPDLPILIALAAIMGHNFPIYLGFRGGKGVSTSLGATFGLDWLSSLAAVVAFGVSLRINRYVSLSSVLGTSVFATTHFLKVAFLDRKSPWDRDQLGFSLMTLGLLALLLIRHRKNWARIAAGTEPKISRRKRSEGRAAIPVILAIGMVAATILVGWRVSRPQSLEFGGLTYTEVDRARTGHQRATAPTFADSGRRLGVLCPRYNRLMIYSVSDLGSLALERDVTLDGQPMALAATDRGFVVLERPTGDDRHIRPGYVQARRFDGEKIGDAVAVGFYPEAMAVLPDASRALILTLGRAEGGPRLPPPSLEVVDLLGGRIVERLPFGREGDRPARVVLSASGLAAVVALDSSRETAALDLSNPDRPAFLGRSAMPGRTVAYPSVAAGDWILMPVDSERLTALIGERRGRDRSLRGDETLASVDPERSSLELRPLRESDRVGRLRLTNSSGFGDVRPTGVASSPSGGLLAVTNRSGGVHMIRVTAAGPPASAGAVASR